MIAASTKFQSVLGYAHRSLSRIYVDDILVPMEAASMQADQTRNVRRTGSLTIGNDPVLSASLSAFTTSSWCVMQKGVQFLDGSLEYVTTATMRVQSIKKTLRNSKFEMQLADQGQDVDDYPLIFPWAPVSGGVAMTAVAGIQFLVEEAVTVSGWTIDVDAAQLAQVTPDGMLFTAGTGRWDAINQLADSIGCKVYVGADGGWVIKQQRLNTTILFDIQPGTGGTLVDAQTTADRRNTYNGIAIQWGTTEIPGSIVLVTDDVVTSPTYWLGSFGKKPKPTQSLPLTTEAAAITAAQAKLLQSMGTQSAIDLEMAYNPLLEPGDIVGVTQRVVARQVHILDSINLDYRGAKMRARSRQVVG